MPPSQPSMPARVFAALRRFFLLDDEFRENDRAFKEYANGLRARVALYGSWLIIALVLLAWPVDYFALRDNPALLARASFWRTIQALNALGIALLFARSSWAKRNAYWLSLPVALVWSAGWPAYRIAAYHDPGFGLSYPLAVVALVLILPFFQRLLATTAVVLLTWISYVFQYALVHGSEPAFRFPPNMAIILVTMSVFGHIVYRLLRSNFNHVALLEKRVAERTADLRWLLASQEATLELERTRISRELHDVMGQLITRLRISTDLLAEEVTVPAHKARIEDMSQKIDMLMASTRSAIHELRPKQLDDGNLPNLVEDFLVDLKGKCAVEVEWEIAPLDAVVSPEIKLAALRIIQEATTNALKHGGCRRLFLSLTQAGRGAGFALEVHDDGSGPGNALAERPSGLGVIGMRERAEWLGAQFTVEESLRLGGTAVRVRFSAETAGIATV